VTYSEIFPTVKVTNVAVTLGIGVWLGWILRNEELRNLFTADGFQEVLFQAVKVWE
jgi:hypothetical protein